MVYVGLLTPVFFTPPWVHVLVLLVLFFFFF